MIIQGSNLYIFRKLGDSYETIANSDSCSLNIACATIPICCRGSLSSRHRRDRYSWNVEVSGLISDSRLAIHVGQPLDVVLSVLWGDLVGSVEPHNISPNESVMLSGKVYISSTEHTASRGALGSWRASFQGDGRLMVGVPAAVNGFPYTFPLIFV